MDLSPLPLPPDARPWTEPADYWPAMSRAVAGLPQPVVTLDLTALEHNVADLVRRTDNTRIRIATKSVRCRPVIEAVLAQEGYAGILTYSLAEAVWASGWCEDVLMGYPSTDQDALRELFADERACGRVTLMVDSVEHLDVVDAVATAGSRPEVRVVIDLDLAHEPSGPVTGQPGVHGSPVATVESARALARAVVDRPGFRLVGVLGSEVRVAGVSDADPEPAYGLSPRTHSLPARARAFVLRRLLPEPWSEVLRRRAAMAAAIGEVAGGLEVVNGGGTGSVHLTRKDPSVTEVTAGSGLFGPTLFDRYRAFAPAPAAAFALPVVRRPAADVVTVAGGGWIASGPPSDDRLPLVTWPRDVGLIGSEGVGEVQTPLRGTAARELSVGDLTWWRHAKAGELAEHTAELVLVRSRRSTDGDEGGVTCTVEGSVLTYRGEGKAYG